MDINKETDKALQALRDLDKYGFGYGSGIPLPVQHYLLSLNKAVLCVLEEIREKNNT